MDLLRSLADGGRTVITVTHSIQSLDRCDRILFLAPGGQTAFFGPPAVALPYFHQPGYAEVFQDLDRSSEGTARDAFRRSSHYQTYVDAEVAGHREQAKRPSAAQTPPPSASWGHQLRTLLTRYLNVIVADRRNTMLLLLQ